MSRTSNEHGNAANAPPETGDLPSTAMTARFLELCEAYGAEHLAVRIVRAGHTAGVPGLPATADSPEWNAKEMRAAVEYLQRKRGRR